MISATDVTNNSRAVGLANTGAVSGEALLAMSANLVCDHRHLGKGAEIIRYTVCIIIQSIQ